MKKIILPLLIPLSLASVMGCTPKPTPTTPPISGNYEYWDQATTDYGLRVVDGMITLGGKNFYSIGVNYYSLFNATLPSVSNKSTFNTKQAFRSLEILAQNNVPVIRFNCGFYYPKEMSDYFDHKEDFLNTLAAIAAKANELNIGLIPSLFWNSNCVPDYYDELYSSWGNPNSQTVSFVKEYTTDIISTLKDYKSIFGWEFGNEYNLQVDLPNYADNRPTQPKSSTIPTDIWLSRDNMITTEGYNYILKEFASMVRELDPHNRMITSGNADLRPTQFRQRHDFSWHHDTLEQHQEITEYLHPAEVDTISEHIYFMEHSYFNRSDYSLYEHLEMTMDISRALKKPYFIGEYGAPSSTDITEQYLNKYDEMSRAFISSGVQLALVWNYDPIGATEFSFSENDEKGKYIFSSMEEWNNLYQERLK